MRFRLVLLVGAAALLVPVVGTAQGGPDSSMAAQTHNPDVRAAQPVRSAPRAPDEPGGADRPRSVENAHPDSECDAHGGSGDETGRGDARAERAKCRRLSDADIALAPIAELRRVTRHQGVIGGRPIAYAATAGTLTLRDENGKPTASMFYVAYTVGEGRGSPRPVTFFYNGGPGSSTVWLHMGSLAPVRVATDSPQATHNAPFALVANNDSLLDRSDLVFLDAVGAGFSRPLGH